MDWSLNWNAVGAIAQAVAAIATFLAVFVALRLGKREDRRSLQVRYDDARPVLIIVSEPQSIPVQAGNGVYLVWDKQPPTIEVLNLGNGPALNVRSVIYGPEAIAVPTQLSASGVSWKHLSNEKENHWYHRTTDAVRQGENSPKKLEYVLAGRHPLRSNIFAEANKYIESKDHKQKYPFNAPEQPISQPNPQEPTRICRVTITYHDIFHRKHASIYDLIFRQGWQVVALIDDVISDLGDLAK